MKTIMNKQQVVVPQGAFASVAAVIAEHDFDHAIVEADADNEGEETITLSITYRKDEREAFHEIEDLISDYEHKGDEDDDDEDE